MTKSLNKCSSQITQRKAQGASQAMLYATGFDDEDMAKRRLELSACGSKETPATCIFSNLEKK